MPTQGSCVRSRISLGLSSVAVLLLALAQPACQNLKGVDGARHNADNRAVEPGLFTASLEQCARLHIVPVRTATWTIAVQTTGTVDWDADHTTQAITQVSGPTARILVDTGSRVAAG